METRPSRKAKIAASERIRDMAMGRPRVAATPVQVVRIMPSGRLNIAVTSIMRAPKKAKADDQRAVSQVALVKAWENEIRKLDWTEDVDRERGLEESDPASPRATKADVEPVPTFQDVVPTSPPSFEAPAAPVIAPVAPQPPVVAPFSLPPPFLAAPPVQRSIQPTVVPSHLRPYDGKNHVQFSVDTKLAPQAHYQPSQPYKPAPQAHYQPSQSYPTDSIVSMFQKTHAQG